VYDITIGNMKLCPCERVHLSLRRGARADECGIRVPATSSFTVQFFQHCSPSLGHYYSCI